MEIDKLNNDLDALIRDDKNDVAHISEEHFIRHLLPILVDSSESADLTVWLDIAGSWRREIAVHDAAGIILFTVPALVGSTTMNNDASLPKVDDVIADSARKSAIVPVSGKNYLVKQLTHRINVEGNYVESIRTWNAIFERYGFHNLIRSFDGSVGTSDDQQNITNEDEPEISGYDEL